MASAPILCGDLLYLLQPSREHLRGLYLRTSSDSGGIPTGDPAPKPSGWAPIDLGDILPTPTTAGAEQDGGFARDAIRAWVTQLRELVDDQDIQLSLGLTGGPAGVLGLIVDELIIGADRLGLERVMKPLLDETEHIAGIKHEQMAARQVAVVHGTICDFVDRLEAFASPPDTAGGSPGTLFAPPAAIEPGELPALPPEPEPFTNAFIRDWLRAFEALAVGNAGYATGQDISPEQNRRLGQILDALHGRPPSPVGTTPTA